MTLHATLFATPDSIRRTRFQLSHVAIVDKYIHNGRYYRDARFYAGNRGLEYSDEVAAGTPTQRHKQFQGWRRDRCRRGPSFPGNNPRKRGRFKGEANVRGPFKGTIYGDRQP